MKRFDPTALPSARPLSPFSGCHNRGDEFRQGSADGDDGQSDKILADTEVCGDDAAKKINMKIDTSAIEQEIANYAKTASSELCYEVPFD